MMKRQDSIGSILGITQLEMATLLGISRSQWSMYELGRGNLPAAATIVLAELLVFAKASEHESDKCIPIAQQKVMKLQLEGLLRENSYQCALTAKKITIAEKKHATQKKVLPLLGILEKQAANQSALAQRFLSIVCNRTSDETKAKAAATLIELQLRQQVLDFERALIETKLKEIETEIK